MRPLLVSICLTACTVDLGTPDSARVVCADPSDCPDGFVCKEAVGVCVRTRDANQPPPSLTDATVTPALAGPNSPILATFTVSAELFSVPTVELLLSPRRALTLTGQDGLTYTFAYQPDGTEPDGSTSVVASLLSLTGNEALDLTVGPVELDSAAPVVSAPTVVGKNPLCAGDTAVIELTIDEALADDPEIALRDGTPLVRETSVSPPSYRYSLTVEATHGEGLAWVTTRVRDEAGNTTVRIDDPVFTLDFTPPSILGTPEALRDAARVGQVMGVTFTMDEPLAGSPTVTAIPRSTGPSLTLNANAPVGTTYTFSLEVSSSHATGVYDLELAGVEDAAGNAAASETLVEVTLDTEAPEFLSTPTVTPARISLEPGHETATIGFTLSEDVGDSAPGVIVQVGDDTATCNRAERSGEYDYTCLFAAMSGHSPGGRVVTISVVDGAGNAAFSPAPGLVLDFTDPGTAVEQLSRTDGFSRASVSATEIYINDEASLVISFLVSESLDTDPVLSLSNAQKRSSSTDLYYIFDWTPSGADRAETIEVTLVDLAGNRATVPIGTVHVDNEDPELSATAVDAMLFERAPWGDGSDPTPYFLLHINATLEADTELQARPGSDLEFAAPIDRAVVSNTGAGTGTIDAPLDLQQDRRDVYVVLQDRASNTSSPAAVRVSNGRWHGALNGKIPDDTLGNPSLSLACEATTAVLEQDYALANELDQNDYTRVARLDTQTANVYTAFFSGWRIETPLQEPSPRHGAALAYDHYEDRVILFGGALEGISQPVAGDTWAWNGSSWEARVSGPAPRWDAAMAWFESSNPNESGLLLYGGRDFSSAAGAFKCNTWLRVAGTWQMVGEACNPYDTPAPPYARRGHGMVHDPATGNVLMLGGVCYDETYDMNERPCIDFWAFGEHNGAGTEPYWEQVLTTPSPALERHNMGVAFDPDRGVLIVAGGFEINSAGIPALLEPQDDVWEWDGSDWTQKCGSGPCATCTCTTSPGLLGNFGFAWDPIRRAAVLVGGNDSDYYDINSTDNPYVWQWDGTDWTRIGPPEPWIPGEEWPLNARQPALAYDHARRRLVVFGGYWSSAGGYDYQDETATFPFPPGWHAGLLTHFDWSAAEIPRTAVTDITIDTVAGADGVDETEAAAAGVNVRGWSRATGTWVTLGGNTSGGSAPVAIQAVAADPQALITDDGSVPVLVESVGRMGSGGGAYTAVDAIELTVDYSY